MLHVLIMADSMLNKTKYLSFKSRNTANEILYKQFRGQRDHQKQIHIQILICLCNFQVSHRGRVVHCTWNQIKRGAREPSDLLLLNLVQLLLSQKELTSFLFSCMLSSLLNTASGIKCFPVDNAGVTSEKRAHSVNTKGGRQF